MNRKMMAIAAVCLVLLLCGCQKKAEDTVVLQGIVTELGQGTATVEITKAVPEEGFVSPVQIMVSDELSGQITLGSRVSITYTGTGTKDMPAGLLDVIEIKVMEE